MNRYMFDSYLVRKKLENTLPTVFFDENITFEQYHLLDLLQQEERLSSTEIANQIGVSKPVISRRCRDLDRRGLIERKVPDDLDADLRLVEYELSDEGRKCLNHLNQRSAAAFQVLENRQGWTAYQSALKKVLEYLNRTEPVVVSS